jgi:hypothetical protein
MKTTIYTILITALLSLMTSCTTSNQITEGGGDECPNSIITLGKQLAQTIDQSSEWDTSYTNASETPSVNSVPAIDVSSSKISQTKSLGKTARGLPTITLTSVIPALTQTIYDTIVVVYDNTLTDSIKNNESIVAKWGTIVPRIGKRTEYYRYLDHDGDSLLINPSAAKSTARIIWGTFFNDSQSTNKITTLIINGGTDNNFQTESDNQQLQFSIVRIVNSNDTIQYSKWTDADNDGVLNKQGSADSSIVDVTETGKILTTSTNNEKYTRQSRIIVYTDSIRNALVRFKETVEYENGTSQSIIFLRQNGDSTFMRNDTVNFNKVTTHTSQDSIWSDSLKIKLILGPYMAIRADDAVVGVWHKITYGISQSRITNSKIFSFTPLRPIYNKNHPVAGIFEYRIENFDNTWELTRGTLSKESITADYNNSQGENATVLWDRIGVVIRYIRKSL